MAESVKHLPQVRETHIRFLAQVEEEAGWRGLRQGGAGMGVCVYFSLSFWPSPSIHAVSLFLSQVNK